MREVPRHHFVPEAVRESAYIDSPLTIGHGQTISQPYIVALMTQLAAIEPHHKVLEVGTGSGYQAAVAARLGSWVWTVEIVPEHAARRGPGPRRGRLRERDGQGGQWLVRMAGAGALRPHAGHRGARGDPPSAARAARPGRDAMVIPVGPLDAVQALQVVDKDPMGAVRRQTVLPVRFVPFTGVPEDGSG